jgi:CRISPR/Cas system CMR subunit Cmr4 (Cas7 group RAMP superfamily)
MADNQISKDLVPQELLDRLDALIAKINTLYDINKKKLTQDDEIIVKETQKKTLSDKFNDTLNELYSRNEKGMQLAKQYQQEQDKLSAETIKYNAVQCVNL